MPYLNLNQDPPKPARYNYICPDVGLWIAFKMIALEKQVTVKDLLTHVIREFVRAYKED